MIDVFVVMSLLFLLIVATRMYGRVACIHEQMARDLGNLTARAKRHSDLLRTCLTNGPSELSRQLEQIEHMNGVCDANKETEQKTEPGL